MLTDEQLDKIEQDAEKAVQSGADAIKLDVNYADALVKMARRYAFLMDETANHPQAVFDFFRGGFGTTEQEVSAAIDLAITESKQE